MSNANLGSIIQGDTFQIDFTVQTAAGAAQDLTGCTITWGCSKAASRATAFLTKTNTDGITVTDAVAGTCSVIIDAGDLSDVGAFFYELEVIMADATSYTFAQGAFTVTPAIYYNT